MKWYLKVLRQYADFSGRAQRKEYWMFLLFNILILLGIAIIPGLIGTTIAQQSEIFANVSGVIIILYFFAMIIPSFAVTVRRLHDVNRSGWMLLIFLIPVFGIIKLLILLCKDSNIGENSYGQDPKGRKIEGIEHANDKTKLSGDYALLHIYRRGSAIGRIVRYKLHLNNDVIFRAKNKSKITFKFTGDEGIYVLWAKTESKTETIINIKAGNEYYIRCGVKMGIFVGRPSIDIVDNLNGKYEFDKIKK
jgi:uncharacterized membrane protein YhaH (DUF805 family)